MSEITDKLEPLMFQTADPRYDPAAPLTERLEAIEAGLRNDSYASHRLAAEVRDEILARKRRAEFFAGIDEAGWSIVLQIYLAEHAGMKPLLGTMIRSSEVGFDNAEHALPSLVGHGWVKLSGFEGEPWLASVSLTKKAMSQIESYFAH